MKINRLVFFLSVVIMGFLTSCGKKHECPNNFTPPDGTFTYSDEGRTNEMLDYPQIVAMLTEYDNTRKMPLEKALGYEDTRINNFNFEQFKKYLGHIENLSDSAKIKITGISFISGAKENYDGTAKSYQSLIYVPTTTIGGKQVAFDAVQSVRQGKLVTLKQMLVKYGYNWPYYKGASAQKMKQSVGESDGKSGVGNLGHSFPPY